MLCVHQLDNTLQAVKKASANAFPMTLECFMRFLLALANVRSHENATQVEFTQSNLVGGWATPLKNMSTSIGMISNIVYMRK